MRKIIIASLLMIFTAGVAVSQNTINIKKIRNSKECDTCYFNSSAAFTEHVNYVIISDQQELSLRTDTLEMLNGAVLKNLSRHSVSSSDFLLDFVPSDRKKIPFNDLEYQLLLNKKPLQDWKSVSLLPLEKDYIVVCDEVDKWSDAKESPAFRVVQYMLNIDDELLVRIRRKQNGEELRNISIERVKITPDVLAIMQFPAGTNIQDILNKVLKKGDSRLISQDELEVDAGSSVLISFDLGLSNTRTVEYAFTDKPNDWKAIDNLNYSPNLLPSYIFLDNPEPGKTISILLRYAEQRESVRTIRVRVKPKLTKTTAFIVTASLVLAFLLFGIIYLFIRRKNKKQVRQLLSRKKDLENKLQLLSGQFNPHFLFNSLNSIQNLVSKSEIEEANVYISELSGFLRTVMDAGKKEFISLKEELDITKGYLQLEQKKRVFQYSIQNYCKTDLAQMDFPPLLLQPVLENSIHHGFTKETTNPTVTIEIGCRDKDLLVIISDNGKGFDTATIKKGHGLDLVEKRIALMNEKPGNNIKMAINSTIGKGTITTFTFNNWL
jgi:hypothetical protein